MLLATSVELTVWYVLAGVLAAYWLLRVRVVYHSRARRRVLSSDSYDTPPSPAPRVAVIVAARNEEADVEACIQSLLTQDYPNFEVIAVDDRSDDRTLEILHRLEAEAAGKLRVLTIRELPPGWFGKCNALREGVAASDSDWLLFTDADCRQTSRRSLTVAMREAAAHQADLISVIPVLEIDSVWERIVQPVCTMALMFWFRPTRVNNPNRSTAYANGAFNLMRRECYEAVGATPEVRAALNEDIQMARLAQAAGFKLWVVENGDLYVTRMYATFKEAWRGWSRLFFGCLQSWKKLTASLVLLILDALAPALGLIWAVWSVFTAPAAEAGAWAGLLALWGIVFLLQLGANAVVYRQLRVARGWSVTYVLGAVVTTGIQLNALLKALGLARTTWRGTTYQRGETLPPAPAEAGSVRSLAQEPAADV